MFRCKSRRRGRWKLIDDPLTAFFNKAREHNATRAKILKTLKVGILMTKQVPLLLNGEFITSESSETMPVLNPATQGVLAQVPFASDKELTQAVEGAKAAFEKWKNVPVTERARLMLRYQHLLKEHQKEIAEILAEDTGKNLEDAMGDVWRGIEVV